MGSTAFLGKRAVRTLSEGGEHHLLHLGLRWRGRVKA